MQFFAKIASFFGDLRPEWAAVGGRKPARRTGDDCRAATMPFEVGPHQIARLTADVVDDGPELAGRIVQIDVGLLKRAVGRAEREMVARLLGDGCENLRCRLAAAAAGAPAKARSLAGFLTKLKICCMKPG